MFSGLVGNPDCWFSQSNAHLSYFYIIQVGLWIDAGSRFENEKNNGVAHFLEHMIFKVKEQFKPKLCCYFFLLILPDFTRPCDYKDIFKLTSAVHKI